MRRCEETKRGQGRVVLLSGEPGIGKSRVARALRDRLSSDPHTLLNYFCSPHHHGSALYPIIGQLTRAAGIERDDGAEAKLNKLQSLLAQSSGNLPRDMPLLAALLSISGGHGYPLPETTPQHRKAQTLTVLLDHNRRLLTRQPILMLFEDLHWIDPTSLELLSLAIEEIRDERVLLVATARPEFTAPWPAHRHVSMLTLNRLGRSDGETLIEAYIQVYGSCGTTFREDEVLASRPVLLLHGTADDWVPIRPCREYVTRVTKAGMKVRLIEYADAYHAFDAPGLREPVKLPQALTLRNCPVTEAEGNAVTKQPFSLSDPCFEKGTTIQYNEAAAKKAHEDVKVFLKEVFAQK